MPLPVHVRLYFDEDINHTIAIALRKHGHDVLTTAEAGNNGLPDRAQLEFASQQGRTLVTCNAGDFVQLHTSFILGNINHCGIIIAQHILIGETIRRLRKLLSNRTMNAMMNRLEFLSSWR